MVRGWGGGRAGTPKSQKAITASRSAWFKYAIIRARYIAHDDDGDPGIGRSPEDDGERAVLVILARSGGGGLQKTLALPALDASL